MGRDQYSPYFPEHAGGLEKHPDGCGSFIEVLEALLHTVDLEDEPQKWWREVFVPGQLLPFVSLFVDDPPGETASKQDTVELVYRVRNFFHSREEIHPTPQDLDMESNPALLPYTEGLCFVFSLDGGAFVACNAPPNQFFRETLPNHLNGEYFLLFLLALQQRFALMMMEGEIARHWVLSDKDTNIEEERERAFENIRDTLLLFTARGYFTQVMQREHHHRVYRRWQEIFQLERMYREVSDEAEAMYRYIEMRRGEQEARLEKQSQEQTARLELGLGLLATLVGLPALGLTFAVAITPTVSLGVASAIVIGTSLSGGLVLAGIRRFQGHK